MKLKKRESKNIIDQTKSYLFGAIKLKFYLEDRGLLTTENNYKTCITLSVFGRKVFVMINRSNSPYFWKIDGKDVNFFDHQNEITEPINTVEDSTFLHTYNCKSKHETYIAIELFSRVCANTKMHVNFNNQSVFFKGSQQEVLDGIKILEDIKKEVGLKHCASS